MATLTINNSDFEYIERGSGTPVVFIHGSINDYRIWKDQMEPFAKQYRAIAYSRRYHYPNEWKEDGYEKLSDEQKAASFYSGRFIFSRKS